MRILITGGCGYVGSALAAHLAKLGHDVSSVDILLRGNPGQVPNNKAFYHNAKWSDVQRADAVVHLAGHSSVGQSVSDPRSALANNLTHLPDLLHMLDSNQKFLWASSASVLSQLSRFRNMYDATKRAAEAIVPLLYPNSYGLRFGTVCGASPNLRDDLIVNRMVKTAVEERKVYVSNKHVYRPILAMRDLCAAVTALLENDTNKAGIYNLSSFLHPVGFIAGEIADMLRAEIVEQPASPTYDIRMSPSLIDGWTPRETLAGTVEDLMFTSDKAAGTSAVDTSADAA